jgi:hypothetical protein
MKPLSQELKERGGSRSVQEAALREARAHFQRKRADAEAGCQRDQRTHLLQELRKMRRSRVLHYHIFEEKLVSEVGFYVVGEAVVNRS